MIIKNFRDSNKEDVKLIEFHGGETFLDLKLAISAQIGVEKNLINLIYKDDIIRNENELLSRRDFQKYECIKYLVVNSERNYTEIKINHYSNKKSNFFQVESSETVSKICEKWIKTYFGEGYAAYLYNDKKQLMDSSKTLLENGEIDNIEYYPVVVNTFKNILKTQYYVEMTPYSDDQIPDIISRLKYHTDCNDDGIEMITYFHHHRLNKDVNLTKFGIDLEMPLIFNILIFNVNLKVYFNDKNSLLSNYPIKSITKCEELVTFTTKKFGIRSNLKIFKGSNVFDLDASMKDIGIRMYEVAIGVNGRWIGERNNIDRHFKYLIGSMQEIMARNYKTCFCPQTLELARIDKKCLEIVDLKGVRTTVEFGDADLTDYLYQVVERICKSKKLKLYFNNEQLEMNKTIESCGIKKGDILQCKEIRTINVAVECERKYNVKLNIDTSRTLSDLIVMVGLESMLTTSQVICLINKQAEQSCRKIKEIAKLEDIRIVNKQKQVTLKLPNENKVPFQMSLLDTCNHLYNKVIIIANEMELQLSLNSFCLYYRFQHITKTDEALWKYDIKDGDEIEAEIVTNMPQSEDESQYKTCKMFYKIYPQSNFVEISYNIKGTGAAFADTIRYNYNFHSDVEIYDLYGQYVDPSQLAPLRETFIFTKVNSKKLNLILPSGNSGEAFVDDRDSISSLKYILSQQFDVYEEGILNMRLFSQSRQLEDDKTIYYYGFRENDTIEIKPYTANIRVKSEDFDFYPVEIFGNESGGDLIQKIKKLTGISENITLIFQNKEFNNHKLLVDLNNDDIIEFAILKDPSIIKLNDFTTGAKPVLQSLPADEVENEGFKLDHLKSVLLSNDETRNVIFFKDETPLLSDLPRKGEKYAELEYIKTETIDTKNGKIVDDLGRGNFGAVQLYQDKEDFNTLFAIKRFLFDNDHKTVYLSLKRELQYAQVIGDSEYLVKAYNCSSDGQNIYLKMEYLSGGSLKSYIDKSPMKRLQESEISTFTRDILQGLKYLHDRNILHRDIKCANVVLDEKKKAKLCDFGLVKLNLDCDRESFLEGFKQTHCGSLCYMAPEVMENEKYGPKADIYSFGATVIEMITGKPPFIECQEEDMLRIKKFCNKIMIKAKRISLKFRKFYQICMSPHPDDRPTVDELLQHDFLRDGN